MELTEALVTEDITPFERERLRKALEDEVRRQLPTDKRLTRVVDWDPGPMIAPGIDAVIIVCPIAASSCFATPASISFWRELAVRMADTGRGIGSASSEPPRTPSWRWPWAAT